MNKRAQASMEFMFNYGWTILATFIVIGAAGYLLLDSDDMKPDTCDIGSAGCGSYTLYDEVQSTQYVDFGGISYNGPISSVEFDFQNPESSSISEITVSFELDGEELLSSCGLASSTVGAGRNVELNCYLCMPGAGNSCEDVLSSNSLNNLDIEISYKVADESFLKFKQGEIISEAVPIETINPILIANINSPSQGSTHEEGNPITFDAEITNAQGSVTCSWSSSLDNDIGSSCSFTKSDLSLGNHLISLLVEDDESTASDSIYLNVEVGTSVPLFSGEIITPTAGTYNLNDPIHFKATYGNNHGPVTCSWISKIGGKFEGSSCDFDFSKLQEGDHLIQVEMTDTDSMVTDDVPITIKAGVPPVEFKPMPDEFFVLSNSVDNVLDVLANDEGSGLKILEVHYEGEGKIKINGEDDAIIYSPPKDFSDKEDLIYVVVDDQGSEPQEVLVSIIVTKNSAALNDEYELLYGQENIKLPVLENDLGEGLTITKIEPPESAEIKISESKDFLYFTPKEEISCIFKYYIQDKYGEASNAQVSVTYTEKK